MGSILVIDDEPGIRSTVKDILEDDGYSVLLAEDGPVGLDVLRREDVDTVVLDVWLPRMGGIDVLKAVKADHPGVEVIVISGHASIDMAVNAVKLGAFDFIEKPLSIDRLTTSIRNARALAGLRVENARLKRAVVEADDLGGNSEAIEAVRALIEQSAKSDAHVLISGENGTGKELAARGIHARSARAAGPFVAVNCAAIPDTLIESELFGHEKGAFTDAVSRRKGRFEAANGGTLFLDEVADMSLAAQSKVLRAIQELRFERVGGEETLSADVRLIAASNKDLRAEIAAGRFREDLFFRLNVIPIRMPSLRERPEDIPALASAFLAELSAGAPRRLSAEAAAAMARYEWPGNVRELKNFLERVAVMSDEDPVSEATVAHFLGGGQPTAAHTPEDLDSLFELRLAEAKDEFERRYIQHILRAREYNVTKAAEIMGVYPGTLHAKIKKLGIEVLP
ncbi:MAG: sigma-54-dependent Fis family transcriptional regulator [Spirochaetia bacterium]|nr:sigma-54-dependent Fis family transcriptional regulator [Spirochaetia bacterium]